VKEMMNKVDVIIVGGGLAGIMAANTLKEAGVNDVLIVEKGKSVGGRLATRRVGGGKADHGTQFFTAFTDLFNKQALNWHENGWTKKMVWWNSSKVLLCIRNEWFSQYVSGRFKHKVKHKSNICS
jgi:renalase